MPRRWSKIEERERFKELHQLYVRENRTIAEVGNILGIAEQTVFQRMRRLGIVSTPHLKPNSIGKLREDILIPSEFTEDLAEFFGIMLGDGQLTYHQVLVTLGTKELRYVDYVRELMGRIFGVVPRVAIRNTGYRIIYLGSVQLSGWLQNHGLVYNKVRAQVDVPTWIQESVRLSRRFLRGFFDTDGSVYRLKFGIQISLTNHSALMLRSMREMLRQDAYHPSHISAFRVYITRRNEVGRFFREICPKNQKHVERFTKFRAGTEAGKRDAL